MSPALIDTGASPLNPNKGQISTPPVSSIDFNLSGFVSNDQVIASLHKMNSSNFDKGFQNRVEINKGFHFSSPAMSKPGSENPAFSSIPGLSRARMTKTRKCQSFRSVGGLETWKFDPGFNPFRVVSDDSEGVSSGIEIRREDSMSRDDGIGNASVLGENNDNVNSKVKFNYTKNDTKLGDAFLNEVRKLSIGNYGDSRNVDSSLGRLNERASVGGCFVRDNQEGFNDDGNVGSKCRDDMSNSNLGGQCTGGSSKNSSIAYGNLGGNHGRSVGFGAGSPLASELRNDFKKLNIKDASTSGGGSFVFGASDNSAFVFGDNEASNDFVSVASRFNSLNIKDTGTSGIANDSKNKTDKPTVNSAGDAADTLILDEIKKLKIGGGSERRPANISSSQRESQIQNMGSENKGKYDDSKPSEMSSSSSTSNPSTDPHFQSIQNDFQMHCMDGIDNKDGLGFAPKQDGSAMPRVEFSTPNPKIKLFSGVNQKVEFSAKRESVKDTLPRRRKGKLKESSPVQLWSGKNLLSNESDFVGVSESSESYSPMDVSPYQEATAAEESDHLDKGVFSNDAADEDLIIATENLHIDIDDDNKLDESSEQCSEYCVEKGAGMVDDHIKAYVTEVETESFHTAADNLDKIREHEDDEVQSGDSRTCFISASSSENSGGNPFTFAASSTVQGQVSAPMRHPRRKNRMKTGPDSYPCTRNAVVSDGSSSSSFSPFASISAFVSSASGMGHRENISTPARKGGVNVQADKVQGSKPEVSALTSTACAAQEACEKWRLRGNQAYASGDLEKAEDYYTQGLSCISQDETSRECLRALVLCYSNRAATRMSLGRMREALVDCRVAAEIDPNFFRVQLRAANCYLALGEVEDASQNFKKLLQATDVCVERKLILEASDGLHKAQKLTEYMERCAEVFQRRTSYDVEGALAIISEALIISQYSEKLLEMKAEALLMLHKYEEVIQLSQQTLGTAERNSPLPRSANDPSLEDSESLNKYSYLIWRCLVICKSYFYLGKLEEAVDFLEKQEHMRSLTDKHGSKVLESSIPLLATVRELLRHKTAGNGAFQAGKHAEAIEHYTAALSCNVESRLYAAICFCNRAAAYQALGQIVDAIADCSLAIALDGAYLKAISRRATLFEMIRDYDQAAKDLEKLLSLLTKQVEEKPNSSAISGSDLRQARQRLTYIEEQAKKGVPLNFYLILGVEPTVSAADLRKAYRRAALRHHPDKAGQSLARSESGDEGIWKDITEEVHKDADKLFKMIGEAYAMLSDPNKRSQYDIEEEMRNGQKKPNSSHMSRAHTEAPIYNFDRSGSGRQWRETRHSSSDPHSRGFESRSSRFF